MHGRFVTVAVTSIKSGLSGLEGGLGTPQSQAISVVDDIVLSSIVEIWHRHQSVNVSNVHYVGGTHHMGRFNPLIILYDPRASIYAYVYT